MKFKTRMINAAVAAALGTVAGAAQAVILGDDGEGQVLLYPYYTVLPKTLAGGGTGNFDTLFTIVNSDSVAGKAVKVRFIEGKASAEVLDFNLYLSPNDMFTGAITRCTAAGGANQCLAVGNPMLRTTDNSCTAAEIPIVSGSGSGATREIAFVNFAYSGTNKDAFNDQSLDRAKEGYIEVIEMGSYIAGDFTYTNSLHSQTTAVPANCAAIRNAWVGSVYNGGVPIRPPTGHLSGALTLINPLEGTDMSVDAVALNNFSTTQIHQQPASNLPDLGFVNPRTSIMIIADGTVQAWQTNWNVPTFAPVSAVSATLDRNQIINEYVALGSPVGFQTDHVITFPTKRLHLRNAPNPIVPFTKTLAQNASGDCESVNLTFYNRDETIQSTQPGFSPPPPSQTNQLCFETNVLSIANGSTVSNVLGSVGLRPAGHILTSNFSEGWLRYEFTQTMSSPALSTTVIDIPTVTQSGLVGATYTGLPVIGFGAQAFLNTSSLSAFGTAYTSRYTRRAIIGP